MYSHNRFKPSLINDLIADEFHHLDSNLGRCYLFDTLFFEHHLVKCIDIAIKKTYKQTLRYAFDEFMRKKDLYEDLDSILLQFIISCIENDSLFEFLGAKYLANLINIAQICDTFVDAAVITLERFRNILSVIDHIKDGGTCELNLIHLGRYASVCPESMSYWLSWLKASGDVEEDMFGYGLTYWSKYTDPQVLRQWKDHFLPTTSADLGAILKVENRELLTAIDELIVPVSEIDFGELFERACSCGSIEIFEWLLAKMKSEDISANMDSYLDYAENNKRVHDRLLLMK